MSEEKKTFVAELISGLKRQRDQLRVQIHLGNEKLKDEWDKLDDKLSQLNYRFDLSRALGLLAGLHTNCADQLANLRASAFRAFHFPVLLVFYEGLSVKKHFFALFTLILVSRHRLFLSLGSFHSCASSVRRRSKRQESTSASTHSLFSITHPAIFVPTRSDYAASWFGYCILKLRMLIEVQT